MVGGGGGGGGGGGSDGEEEKRTEELGDVGLGVSAAPTARREREGE